MNKQSAEFKIEVADIFKRSKNYITDEIMQLPDGTGKSRFRRTVIGLSQGIINHTNSLVLPVYDVYSEVLEMLIHELRTGFGAPLVSIEQIDHQVVDWALIAIESIHSGKHPWCQKLQQSSDIIIAICISYGSLNHTDNPEPTKEVAILPGVFMQLIQGFEDEERENEILDVISWDISRDAIQLNKNDIDRLGRE